MTLATRPSMTDDTGTFDNGTVCNEALIDSTFDAVDDQCHSTTNTTTKPKAITDEVITARGNKANLNARLIVGIDADGVITGATAEVIAARGSTGSLSARLATVIAADGTLNSGRRLTTDVTAGASVGAAETTLVSYTVTAGLLTTNGQSVRFKVYGATANNANVKTLRVYFGATVIATFTLTINSAVAWSVEGEIVRTAAATQLARVSCQHTDTAPLIPVTGGTPAETLSGTVLFKVTGQATTNSDITEALAILEFLS